MQHKGNRGFGRWLSTEKLYFLADLELNFMTSSEGVSMETGSFDIISQDKELGRLEQFGKAENLQFISSRGKGGESSW